MNCWILLAAGMVSCPWGRPVVHARCYSEPVYCLPSRPMVVYRSAISPPVAVQVQEVVTENAMFEESLVAEDASLVSADAIAEAAALEEEELVTEPAAFQSGYGLSLSELALDWGVAVIGPGTLYPQDYGVMSGGLFGGGGGAGRPQAGGLPLPDCNCPEPPSQPGPGGEIPPPPPSSGGEPVPEPMSLAIWTLALTSLWFFGRRRKAIPQPVAVRSEP